MSLDKIYKLAYLRGSPNLAHFILHAIAVPDHPVLKTAATDGLFVYYNPEFINSLTTEEALGVFAHEYYHIVYEHCRRGIGKEPTLYNIAADVVINEAVTKRWGFDLPSKGMFRGKGTFKDLPDDLRTTDKIYNWLLRNSTSVSASESQKGQEEQDQREVAQGLGDERTEEDKAEAEARKRAAQSAEMAQGKRAGLSEELKEAIGLPPPDLEWMDLVTAMKIESGRLVHRMHKRSFSRPARYEPAGLIRPHNYRYQKHPKVDVYIDVSGSMGDNPLTIFNGLKSILGQLRIYRPSFYAFNTGIFPVNIKADRFSIGGGTDIKKVLNKIYQEKADLAILVTDCEDSVGRSDIKENVVVVSDSLSMADYYTNDWTKVRKSNQH